MKKNLEINQIKLNPTKKNKVITGEEIRKIINQMDYHLDNYYDKFEDITYGLEKILVKHEKTDELKSIRKKLINFQNKIIKLKTENDKLKFAIKTFNQIKSEDKER